MHEYAVEVEAQNSVGQAIELAHYTVYARSEKAAASEARVNEASKWLRPVLVEVKSVMRLQR